MPTILSEESHPYIVAAFFLIVLWFARKSPVALAIPFVLSNLFKGWFQTNVALFERVDFTIGTSALMGMGALWSLLRRPALKVYVPWFLLFAHGLILLALYVSTPTYFSWATREYLRVMGFGTVAILCPGLLVRRLEDLLVLWKALVAATVLVAITSLLSPPTKWTERGTFLMSTTPINVGIVCAALVIMVASLSPYVQRMEEGISRTRSFIVIGIALLGLINTGSRGPFLNMLVTLVVLLLVRRDPIPKRLFVLALSITLLFGVWYMLPEHHKGVERIETLRDVGTMSEDPETSIGYRFYAWKYVLEHWTERPIFGHGAGVLESRLGIQSHSLALELLYAGGGFAFLTYWLMIGYGWRKWLLRPRLGGGDKAEWLSLPAFMLSAFYAITSITGLELGAIRVVYFWLCTTMAALEVMKKEVSLTTGLASKGQPHPT